MTLMQSGKKLLNPFNANALLMFFTADLQNAELKHMRIADIMLIDIEVKSLRGHVCYC